MNLPRIPLTMPAGPVTQPVAPQASPPIAPAPVVAPSAAPPPVAPKPAPLPMIPPPPPPKDDAVQDDGMSLGAVKRAQKIYVAEAKKEQKQKERPIAKAPAESRWGKA